MSSSPISSDNAHDDDETTKLLIVQQQDQEETNSSPRNNDTNNQEQATNYSSHSSQEESFPETTFEHVKRIMSLALSFAVTFYCIFSFTLISAAFIGKTLGSQALSGFGLGVSFVNLIGLSSITGLVMGLDTLLPMAFGISSSHPAIAKTVQRCFASVFLWCFFIAAIFATAPLWFHKVFAARDDENVAAFGAKTVRMGAIILLPYLLEEILQSYLGAMNRAVEIFVGAFCGAVVNPILLYCFVYLDWIGFEGAIISWCLSIITMFTTTLLLARYRNAFDETWVGINCKVMWSNWKPFLRAAIPAAAMMLCEWSVFEVVCFSAAKILPSNQFTAHVIIQQLLTFVFPMVLGISISVNILVGNDVGAGNPASAKKTAWVGFFLILLEFFFDALLVYTPLNAKIASLFSSDPTIVDLVVNIWKLVFLSHIWDSLFCLMGSIIRALGHNRVGVIFAFVGYYIVGLTLGLVLATKVMEEDHKIYGIWTGPICGQFVGFALSAWYVGCKMEWVMTDELTEDLALIEEQEDD